MVTLTLPMALISATLKQMNDTREEAIAKAQNSAAIIEAFTQAMRAAAARDEALAAEAQKTA
jgi:hypothetical protein